jgi:hypothetical protein
VRELLAEFPTPPIEALVDAFKQQRAIERRLAEHKFDPADQGNLICYSDVVHPAGGLKQGGSHAFFMTHAGRDYLVEDHYCCTPDCDCRQVHFEFWVRTVSSVDPLGKAARRIDVAQLIMAAFTFDGEVREVGFSQEDAETTRAILAAWGRQCSGLKEELERRYQQIKSIGRRSFPPAPAQQILSSRFSVSHRNSARRVRRNDLCPCGSGRKFKRCCARQTT